MSTVILCSAIVYLGVRNLSASSKSPAEFPEHLSGSVQNAGEVTSLGFPVKALASVEILGADVSCSCVHIRGVPRRLRAGESVELEIVVDTEGFRPGTNQKKFFLLTDKGGLEHVMVEIQVLSESQEKGEGTVGS